ncbi:MAG: hypothetical protein HFI30_14555 [Lachnospiraceae bacterium]|jgi:hypothetical protein|nr:hypothetical protein [Lachnospiraceae bacterium]
MLEGFLTQARADEPVYITDVRNAFQKEGKRPFHLQVTLYDGSVRSFPMQLPMTKTSEEEAFVASYVHAMIYNILSSLGAVKIGVYVDQKDEGSLKLARELDEVFQTALAKKDRFGYGKSLNVNERILAVLLKGKYSFCFQILDLAQEPVCGAAPAKEKGEPVFAALPQMAEDKMLLGIDIGGTDIKLTASVDGNLAVYKEFDWFPAAFSRAEELMDPVKMITGLMRAAASLYAAGRESQIDQNAMGKDASLEEMEQGLKKMEELAGESLRNFDAIGLSFPDVVIQNLIVGGETFKTRGMRENTELDYEEQFAKISVLCEELKEYVTETGAVMNTNDGPMAAFTAAVEQAVAGADVSNGFFAHTLGTELGTGWVLPDGSIPEIPLEVYNFIIDLGSFAQKEYEPNDVRSINNFNTGLPGTLQKYTCQSGVFRLAVKTLPKQDPAVYEEAFALGLFVEQNGQIVVPTEPKDMRKPCLEFFMAKAGEPGHEACAEIFRQVGEYLAVTWEETEYILEPEAKERSLFGRLVKSPVCFKLMCEGAARREPELRQYAADGGLANTRLMKQLEAHPDYTVAQFAQAVGAIYFGCLGL